MNVEHANVRQATGGSGSETTAGPGEPGAEVPGGRQTLRDRVPNLAKQPILGPVAILVVLVILFALINPRFLSFANIVAIVDGAAAPMVIAIGLTLVILLGSIDLSVEGVIAAVSVIVALLLKNSVNGNDFGVAAVAIALGIGLVFGLLNGLIHTMLRLPSLIVTLGTWFIGLGVGYVLFPANPPTISDDSFLSLSLHRFLGFQWVDYIALAVVIVIAVLLRFTVLGRMLFGIGGAEDLVRLAGVRVTRYKVAAFAIAGLLSAIAGLILTSQLGTGNVTAGSNQLFPGISAVVVGGTLLSGGKGGLSHTVIGVLILAVLSNGMILSDVSPYIQQAVVGLIIVVAVVGANWRSRQPLRVIK